MKWINESIEDFLAGYSKNRPYNEEIGQMYLEQLKAFKYKLLNKKPSCTDGLICSIEKDYLLNSAIDALFIMT